MYVTSTYDCKITTRMNGSRAWMTFGLQNRFQPLSQIGKARPVPWHPTIAMLAACACLCLFVHGHTKQ